MNSINLAKKVFLSAIGFALSASSYSLEKPIPPAGASSVEFKTLIVENVYSYELNKYTPSKQLNLITDRKSASYADPAAALVAHFSAMKAADFDWFLNSWSANSRVEMMVRDKKLNRSSSYWIDLWSNWGVGDSFELLNWIQYGRYVLIQYQLKSVNGNKKLIVDTVALIKDGQEWKLTQDLANDPILVNWNNQRGRIQVAPNSMISP